MAFILHSCKSERIIRNVKTKVIVRERKLVPNNMPFYRKKLQTIVKVLCKIDVICMQPESTVDSKIHLSKVADNIILVFRKDKSKHALII